MKFSSNPEKIPIEKMLVYRAAARERCLRRQHEWAKRQERALSLAYQAAALLKEAFGAKQVVLFGSLARGSLFDMRSDVDLAVWGLDGSKYRRTRSWGQSGSKQGSGVNQDESKSVIPDHSAVLG